MTLEELLTGLGAENFTVTSLDDMPETLTLSDLDGQDMASFIFDGSPWLLSLHKVTELRYQEQQP